MLFQDEESGRAVRVAVKAVPGSRRSSIVGRLGERLKIKVTAPAEDGRANAALCELLAAELGVSTKAVSVIVGHASAEKIVRIEGKTAAEMREVWP